MVIADSLRRMVKAYPNKIAVIDKFAKYTPINTTYTWHEFNEKVNKLANGFLALGLRRQDRVAIFSETRSQYFIIQQAILKVGLVFVPLNPMFKGKELAFEIKDSGTKVLFIDSDKSTVIEEIRSELKEVKFFIGIGKIHSYPFDFDKLIQNSPPHETKEVVEENDLAMLLYTSGTTGKPKGVMLTQKNWCFAGIIIPAEWRMLPHYKFLHVLAPYFAGGILFMMFCVFRGYTIVFSDFNPEKVMKIIEEKKIDYIMFAPTMTNFMIKHPSVRQYDYSSLKWILTSAAPISASLLKEASKVFGDVYTMTYGITETAAGGTQLYPEDVALEGPKSKRLTSVGKAMIGMDVKILDEERNEIPPGSDKVGEVVISGPTVGLGYWNKPGETELKDGTCYTGDLAKIDEDGFIYIMDRKKDMINSGGRNIYPREVEDVLYSHPSVIQAAVIGVPSEEWGESVKAILVLKEGAKVSEEEIIEFCRQNLTDYKKPRSVEFRESLPLNPAGKILRRELRGEFWKDRERKV